MFLMVIAGNETTTKLLANAAFWGHRNPDQLRPVYDDLSRVPLWVEETLRYDTSSQILARTVVGDFTLYDTMIPDGDVVLLLPGSAHRDERVFDDPDDYVIGREIGSKLLSFGSGAHFCLGAHLARMEARVALAELFTRIRGLRGGRGQRGPRPLEQRPRLRPPAHPRDGALKGRFMPRFDPLPERRPAIVAGASSGIGEATAIELAAHGFPVALGARRVEKLPGDRRARSAPTGGEAVGFHLDVTDPDSVKSFVAAVPVERSATSRCWWPARATPTSASWPRSAPTSSTRSCRSTWSAPTGWPPRCCPACSNASAVT